PGPYPEPERALPVGPAPELLPQYPPGTGRPGPHDGGVAGPRAGSAPVPPGAPDADCAGRAGDAPALSRVHDASVATACSGHHACSPLCWGAGRQGGGAPPRLCRRERRESTDGALLVPAVSCLHEQG